MATKKRDTELEKASREWAREHFRQNPNDTANQLLELMKDGKYWLPSDPKSANVWANNQKRAALGTKATVRKAAKPSPIQEAQLGRQLSEIFHGPDKAIEALEAVKKLGTIADAIKAVKRWQAVLKAEPKASAAIKILDALK
jgi:hypothetical protein